MTWLRVVLAAKECGVAFLHGQAFFALGFSIVFLARRSARLEVARGLPLLAIFGFCEALVAWSPLFLVSPGAPVFDWLRLILTGAGYAFLLAFAVQTQVPAERSQWQRWLPAGALLGCGRSGCSSPRLRALRRPRSVSAVRSPLAMGWRSPVVYWRHGGCAGRRIEHWRGSGCR